MLKLSQGKHVLLVPFYFALWFTKQDKKMCRHDQFRSTLRRNLFPLESCRWWVSCSTHNRKINSAHHSRSGGVYSERVAQTLVHNLLKKLFQACFVAWSRRDCILAQTEKKVKLKCRVYSLKGPVYTWLGVTLDMQSFIIFFLHRSFRNASLKH